VEQAKGAREVCVRWRHRYVLRRATWHRR
jgi:hypothetical protein